MSEATQQVAADLTAGLLAEAAAGGFTEPPAPVVAAPPVPPVASVPAETAPVAAPVEAATVEVPELDFTPRLSDDLQALLEEPDFDEEAAAEVVAEMEGDEYEYVDPEIAKKLKALEKRNAWLEQQNIAKSKKTWVDENLRSYPLLAQYGADELKALDATSRRAFARKAAELNARYERALGPALADIAKAKAALTEGAVTVARQEVAASWGTPASDTLPAVAEAKQQALEEARKKGLGASIRELLKP